MAYTEFFTAKVNNHAESELEEVVLRGTESAHTFIIRNVGEKSGIEDGKTYKLTLTKTNADQESEDAGNTPVAAPKRSKRKAPKTALPKTNVNQNQDSEGEDAGNSEGTSGEGGNRTEQSGPAQ